MFVSALARSLAGIAAIGISLSIVSAAEAPAPDFEHQILPMFESRCFSCHGAEQQKSGLRLDSRDAAFAGGDSGVVIVPQDPDASELLRRISGVEPADTMPPKGDPLTPEEVELVRAWIAAGAEWPQSSEQIATQSDHWAFQTPVRPELPKVSESAWVSNPIDNFVLAELESQGIAPSLEADRDTLIRRLHFDLTGLPPSPDEVDEFVQDSDPNAYMRLVNRLLASPHFGERWGRHWLDLARYADTDGFEKDSMRPWAYRYRDWVIDAFNRDLPYDQFVIQQLAGDLLPKADSDTLLATGFHRNTLTNREGGVDQEEFRVEQVIDRTNTTASVFMGLTMACAQCHSHKYDPLTQREYYGLYAFFNSGLEKDVPAPLPGETEAYKRAKKDYDAKYSTIAAEASKRKEELLSALPEWEKTLEVPAGAWETLVPVSFASAGGANFERLDDNSLLLKGVNPATDLYTVIAAPPSQPVKAIRLEALTHPDLTKNGPGRAHNGNFVLAEFRVFAAPATAPLERKQVAIASVTADFEQEGLEAALAIDGDPNTGWAIYREENMNEDRSAVFILSEPVSDERGLVFTFELEHRYGREHTIGRFRLATTTIDPASITMPENLRTALLTPAGERNPEQQNLVLEHFASQDTRYREIQARLDGLRAGAPQPPATLAQAIVENPEPPRTHIHVRGNFLTPGDEVAPHTPAVLPAIEVRGESPDRLDLARWLVSHDHPLTARVQVNRMWTYLFGEGLVSTLDDFGTRGETPTHPELLDWLATEFVNEGWSMKDMIRLIVTSSTYKQASHERPELVDVDPENRLLARQNRFHLEAEVVRDAHLAASGLLNDAIGGSSIRPPLPDGVADLGYANSVKWTTSEGDDKYRRGLYIFFQRTVPYPMLMTFDCPDSNKTVAARNRSNTPLQALNLLNGPVFIECAQELGRDVLGQAVDGDDARIRYVFRRCMGRQPSDGEVARLQQFLEEQREAFQQDADEAAKFAGGEQPSSADPAEAAAYTALSRVVMNLDEFITRE